MFVNFFFQVGSYTIAVCAKAMKKPFYVLTESFKFSRLFPLGQQDLPEEYKVKNYVLVTCVQKGSLDWDFNQKKRIL